MATEKFVNDARSQLAAGINDAVTTLTVDDATTFPTSGDFRVKIGSELMLVTGVSGETFTVTRGIEGTTPASHAMGDYVSHIVTAASLERIISQVANNLSLPLAASDFSQVNFQTSGASASDGDGAVTLRVPPRTTNYQSQLLGRSFTSGSVIIGLETLVPRAPSCNVWAGVGFYDSTGGKLSLCGAFASNGINSGFQEAVQISNVASVATAPSTTVRVINIPSRPLIRWYKLALESSNLVYYVSNNGQHWSKIYSQARSTALDNNPNMIVAGAGNFANLSTDPDILVRIRDWIENP